MNSNRFTPDEYFLNIALVAARRSTCPRLTVGAICVADDHVISTGYNGSPSGMPHCTDVGCVLQHGHCVATVHAEMNALLTAHHGSRGATLYTTHCPCIDCAKACINAGILKIVYDAPYIDNRTHAFGYADQAAYLSSRGIEVVQCTLEANRRAFLS